MRTVEKHIGAKTGEDFWKRTPKYSRVKGLIEEGISGLKPGDRIASVRDLKRKFKISQSTLDRALIQLEGDGLISRKWGSGIYVNRKGMRKKTRLIGVVVSDIRDRFCALLVEGIERKLSEDNYRVIVCNGHEEFRKELGIIHSLREKIDGLIINPRTVNIHNPEYVRYFLSLEKTEEVPFVLVDIPIPGIRANLVGFDDFGAFRDISQIMLNKMNGDRTIYLAPSESLVGIQRLNGLREGLREAGVNEEKVSTIHVNSSTQKLSIPWQKLGRKRQKPVFFFIASPPILPRLITLIQNKKLLVPEEALIISVVEEDYKDYITVPIIALVKPSSKLGEEAVRVLRGVIDGKVVQDSKRLKLGVETPENLKRYLHGNPLT